jgi:hypothetical protein
MRYIQLHDVHDTRLLDDEALRRIPQDRVFRAKGRQQGHLLKDSLRTLQYVIEAIVYYNPLKIFLLFSLICVMAATILMIVSLWFSIVNGIMLSIAIVMAGVIMFGIGMLAVLLKQIMDKA